MTVGITPSTSLSSLLTPPTLLTPSTALSSLLRLDASVPPIWFVVSSPGPAPLAPVGMKPDASVALRSGRLPSPIWYKVVSSLGPASLVLPASASDVTSAGHDLTAGKTLSIFGCCANITGSLRTASTYSSRTKFSNFFMFLINRLLFAATSRVIFFSSTLINAWLDIVGSHLLSHSIKVFLTNKTIISSSI